MFLAVNAGNRCRARFQQEGLPNMRRKRRCGSSGFFSIASPCPTCSGEGYIIDHPCKSCSGSGLTKKQQKMNITIPAGIESGKRISISGQGDAGPNGGPAGDLYVYISVTPHEFFERQGSDVYCVVPISFTQASLGADVHVPSLDDKKIKVKVPAGTQNGKILRVRGEGVPILHGNGRRGDMYIKIMVRVPTRLSSRAKALLKEFSEIMGEVENPEPVPLAEL